MTLKDSDDDDLEDDDYEEVRGRLRSSSVIYTCVFSLSVVIYITD